MRFSIIAVDIPLPADFPFPLRGSYEECARRAAAFGYEAIERRERKEARAASTVADHDGGKDA